MCAEDWMKILGWPAENAGGQKSTQNKESPAIERGTRLKKLIAIKGSSLLDAHLCHHLRSAPGHKSLLEGSLGRQSRKGFVSHHVLEGCGRKQARERVIPGHPEERFVPHPPAEGL